MSLIHDALKRIEKPADVSSGREIPKHLRIAGEESDDQGSRKKVRMLALVVVLITFAVYFVYQRVFTEKLQNTQIQAEVTKAVPPQNNSNPIRNEEVDQLKETASKSFELGNFDDAWVHLSTAGQISPTDYEIWNNMGLVSKSRGEHDKAREFYEKAVQLKEDCAECLNNLAVLDIESGDYTAASEFLEKAVSIKKEYPEAFFHIAILAEKQGDFTKAVDYYKKFMATSKDNSSSFFDEVRKRIIILGSK